ncbi:MAG: RsmE family RNA methyltransferase [Bacteroidetes bacterium]|nr:RsmE family RNA methyltransferase [Bacteroidota bacterium]
MNLFFSNFCETDNEIIVNENDSRHILKTYRRDIGDIINFTNGNGLLAECKIIEKGKKVKVKIKKLSKQNPEKTSIHIAISPLKNQSRFEWFVEKATEIGIREITPIITKHSEKKKVNHERLERITISSLKQSNQVFKPKINNTEKFSDFLKNNKDQKIMANLKTKNILEEKFVNSNQVCLIIGPEGGFSDDEIQEAKNNNITEVSFGNNRLRSETAAIYGLSILRSIIT